MQRVCNSRRVYAKNSLVTPYFYCEAAHRASGGAYYALDGGVGVIHRGFEESWAHAAAGEGNENVFATVSHIANYPDIRPQSFIRTDNIERGVSKFVEMFCPFLERMPQTEDDLVVVFRKGELCEQELKKGFSSVQNRKKFASFAEFVNHLPIPQKLKN